MHETVLTYSLFGLTGYWYGTVLALGALIALIVLRFSLKRQGEQKRALSMLLWMLPCALIGSRLGYCLCILEQLILEGDLGFILRLSEGGYLMFGALVGCALGLLGYSLFTKKSFAALCSIAAPAIAVMIAVERAAECLTAAGVGWVVENEALMFFPLAVQNEWEEWRYAVFLLEALTALGIGAYLLTLQKKGRSTVSPFLICYMATQLLMESLRKDDVMAFGFVKAQMVFSALTLLGLVVYWMIKRVKGAAVSLVTLVLGCGAVTALEFALDKSPLPNEYVYLAMAVVVGVMCWLLLKRCREADETLGPRVDL